ncbi:undecaprenyl diphosphate synthase [Desulfofarcimen acetoxidans DSM 771]|jgi:undecaprenyl diphosphate synthase|uniref:Isoprenyl transferase n=1 Tax=Desulfofarcimen acetoxidans (strain ATCC 49208 / DSM 771 / KCTC 5769 / VKM B-1644 / 5575) TaxID=485916 RepID=C8W4R3_DESAS|nr:isoprenyl transferase [Desulfofarcimen acetoxidans]ACV63949.1 undecaprenyl diphosphate synthase [Desulfofarcimen acetoxidans DSM 771]
MLNNFLKLWRGKGSGLPVTADEEALIASIDPARLPKHIAIIMDGNGRWAKKRGLPRALGHRAGVDALRNIVKLCRQLEIEYLTCYAFSTENWKRPPKEVTALMNLLVEFLQKEIDELCANYVRVSSIGRTEELPPAAQKALQMAVNKSSNNNGLILNLALNYGGRAELVEAVRQLAREVKQGLVDPEAIDENTIGRYLYTSELPDPDLLIRTSGDFRISNFLLWQLAYTEFWLTPVLWPDFKPLHLLNAIVDYQNRERRFGGIKDF